MRLGVGAALVDGEVVPGDVAIEDGAVAEVGLTPAGTGIAVPGFVDAHINGYAGVDFLRTDLDGYRHVRARAGRHRRRGPAAHVRDLGARGVRARVARGGRGGAPPTATACRWCWACTWRARSCRPSGRARTTPSTCGRPTPPCSTSCWRRVG